MQGIMDLLNQEGHYDAGEEDEIVYVTSYYINHHHHRFHDEPRVLRFDRDVAEWERDVRFIWEDLVDHDAPIDIVIVRPDPPKFAYPATAATVIVHQHASPERAACLISQVHVMDPETRFSETAHSRTCSSRVTRSFILQDQMQFVNKEQRREQVNVLFTLDIISNLLMPTLRFFMDWVYTYAFPLS